tara:strand:+ start:97 stop:792 length:696 start_codon:yes stop_codon:yes gene_type:complete
MGNAPEENKLSMAMENYLLSILRLEEQSVVVTITKLAEHFKDLPKGEGLGTSVPSVSAMLKRMAREKLVVTNSSKEINLTDIGRQSAESILRRHRLAKKLVVDVLKVELPQSHEEAHRLEHAISPYLENKIVDLLGHPTTCPFGHPIPGSSYKPKDGLLTLNEAKVGRSYTVDRLPEDDRELLEYFVGNEFLPGANFSVTDCSMPRGIITLGCGEKELVFSLSISALIWVY